MYEKCPQKWFWKKGGEIDEKMPLGRGQLSWLRTIIKQASPTSSPLAKLGILYRRNNLDTVNDCMQS